MPSLSPLPPLLLPRDDAPVPDLNNGDADIIIYGYIPALALALLGIILFLISTLLHSYQLFRYRTWYLVPLALGTLIEAVGYIFRLMSHYHPYRVIYFVLQYFCIVVAPVLFSACIYVCLSLLIRSVGTAYAPLPPKLILYFFIGCDVLATVVQVAGAASIGSAESSGNDPTTANHILLAGLAFQVFAFLVFVVLFGLFLYRARKVLTRDTMPFTAMLCAATVLIYLRTCFRLAETAQGLMQSLSSHEAFFGCLEFAPVVVAVCLFNIWHPGKWIPRYK
ncbi:MAG: hypothetical protein M1829_001830 [Trizodia sp. TS-e1964]|nr:MAG: hypothetical protein M1829_001830 [Trizodia sp. TS-e1964]